MWQNRFHGNPNVVDKEIRLNRHQLNIIGVAPPDFRGSSVGLVSDVWMPITMAGEMGTGDGTLNYRGCRDLTSTIVRLKPSVTPDQAQAEVSALAKRLAAEYPGTNRGVDAIVVPVWGWASRSSENIAAASADSNGSVCSAVGHRVCECF